MYLNNEKLNSLVQSEDINQLSARELTALFTQELHAAIPDGILQLDPRNNLPVIYNKARAKRPHDNKPADKDKPQTEICVICEGRSTGIIDKAPLSLGSTFINKNLFPMLFPEINQTELPPFSSTAKGLHFLQWTSTQHNLDWQNMPINDLKIVLQRLGSLEEWLLNNGEEVLQTNAQPVYVSIGKNYGRLVGGSLVHGHQQIVLSDVCPNRIVNQVNFQKNYRQKFSDFVLQNNPAGLTLCDYPSAKLLVPYFMARPYQMFLVLKNSQKEYLYQGNDQELTDISRGWQDAIRLIRWIMPMIGKELAYNVIAHNGPGTGLYFEFLPYTQEMGCFEHMGLYVCQSTPQIAAETLRKGLETFNELG